MHTSNSPQNSGPRQGYYGGPPRQPFIPGNQTYFVPPQPNGQRPLNQAFIPQLSLQNTSYPQYPQVVPMSSSNSPPSIASTPGLPPPTNNGNPLQPGPAVYYQPQRPYIPQPQPQVVYVPVPPHGAQMRGPQPQYVQRPPMQYSGVSQNYNINARYPTPHQNMQPMETTYYDSTQQIRPPYQPNRNSNYQGRIRRGGGGNTSRRGSVRHDGRPDSSNRSSPPETQLPPFAEQNMSVQGGQIMHQNQMYSLPQMPGGMMPQGQPMYMQTQVENPMGQQIFFVDPNQFQQQYTYVQLIPPQQMQHVPVAQQSLPQIVSQASHEPLDFTEFTQAIKVIQEEEKMQHQGSPEKTQEDTEPAAVPAMDATSVQGDVDDYTPPGTPQSLNPLNEQQMNQLVEGVSQDIQQVSQAHEGNSSAEKVEDRKQEELPRKRNSKPEQQHYQPPRAGNGGRPNATMPWRSNPSQQQQSHLSRITEEKSKSPAHMGVQPPPSSTPQSQNVSSSTPTPRASPVLVAKPKEVHKSDVPMVGGIPLIPSVGGLPLSSAAKSEQSQLISTPKEHCAYCDMLRKPLREITNHSLFSSKGIPACPAFREDGCKLCGLKGDSAHLVEFCKKYMNRDKENVEFKQLANHLFSMSQDDRRSIRIMDTDWGNHPKVNMIESHPDERYHTDCATALKKVFVRQMRFNVRDQVEHEQNVRFEEQQRSQQQSQRYYDERNYRGSRSGPRGGGYFRGGDRGGPRGGGGGPPGYFGSRSRDGGGRGGMGGGRGRFDQARRGDGRAMRRF